MWRPPPPRGPKFEPGDGQSRSRNTTDLLVGEGGGEAGDGRARQVPLRVHQVEGVGEGGRRQDQLRERGTQAHHHVNQSVLHHTNRVLVHSGQCVYTLGSVCTLWAVCVHFGHRYCIDLQTFIATFESLIIYN